MGTALALIDEVLRNNSRILPDSVAYAKSARSPTALPHASAPLG